jgi:hypothetical protein
MPLIATVTKTSERTRPHPLLALKLYFSLLEKKYSGF